MSSRVPPTTTLLPPAAAPPPAASTVASGPVIPAVDRIRLFDPGAWEDFIREWADALRGRYVAVDRFGGAGDMGCDVVATASYGDWDNFQCKHYDHPLWPSDAWTELGKIVYYTWRGDLSAPRTYYFVAPQGVGTTLSNLLRQPARLREHLLANWDTHCRAKITDKVPVELEAELRAHIERFDFSIFRPLSIHRVLDEHAQTRWHASRFGGGLPPRPLPEPAPQDVQPGEARYVRALLDAYSDHLRRRVQTIADLAGEPGLDGHFTGARHEFYSSEALRLYARETLPPQTFEDLQDQIEEGIADELYDQHQTAYRRVLAVTRTARALALDGHVLNTSLRPRDRGGICHQLANDDRLTWTT